MKWTGAIACVVVGLDCIDWATGRAPQTLFSPDLAWVWWGFAFVWFISAFRFAAHPKMGN
jgi:hypothetical protein